MTKFSSRSLRWVKITLPAALPVSLLLFLLLRRHQYMSTPQYAFHEFRTVMANGDLELLAQYASPRLWADERHLIERRHQDARKRGLPLNALNWHAEQRENNELQRFGVRWVYRDKTHVEARARVLIFMRPLSPRRMTEKIAYFLILTNQGWVCDNRTESGTL